ncbi:S-adenosyl-L-methionine-dependent methyltransferase [Sparassis latifolia]|uniref:S-adenosyl-L-methionine-dependent methyltransferase n=1 Tax=Sparassis crispa TaxID=139825 RepID=A0A401GAX5_9APHY|nr:S-adenosyl-L-methionine-dependent methyltransferase [Sparassis crispa]GBE79312.1 S-adenosyl-L-methionine-dependent methyltransferase [Sparassis crispa]
MALLPGNPIQQRVRDLISEHREAGWDKAWQENVTPWDAGQPQPALRQLVESKILDLPTSGRALIPGCGRGYDAMLIATNLGLDTLAVDISPTAVAAAKAAVEGSNLPSSVKVTIELDDFFALASSAPKQFDLVYDYTFFVAILPSQRDDWGRTMSSIVKPGGYLITLVFPIDPPQEVGPPFYVRPEHYVGPLGAGWEKVYDEAPEVSLGSHAGRERMIVWKRLL